MRSSTKIYQGYFGMFSKNKSDKLESFLGARTVFEGEFLGKGNLRIDGSIQGRVKADCVVLSKTGVIKGEVKAAEIIVGGKVEGSL